MSDKHYVITIERQYGSGGRITGMRLAEELGIHYYDDQRPVLLENSTSVLQMKKQGITYYIVQLPI